MCAREPWSRAIVWIRWISSHHSKKKKLDTPELEIFVKNWWKHRSNWHSRNFCVFISVWRTFWFQVALKNFPRIIWWRSIYLKGFLRPELFSGHNIMRWWSVEVELSLRKHAKDKILFFRANLGSRNFCNFQGV